jgi:hypothetical protein
VKATPILVVDAVEPSRQFFCERLGYEVIVEVPHGDARRIQSAPARRLRDHAPDPCE